MNKIILIGNLTRDPEVTTTPSDVTVAKFSVAVARKFKNKDGEKEVDYINVVAWRALAENCGRYLEKGKKVAVEGSLQIRSYDDKEGNKRYVTEVIASDVEFLTPKAQTPQTINEPEFSEVDDDELPF